MATRIYFEDNKIYFVDIETGATKLLDIVIPKTDTISEKTAGVGVTIDGILLKDDLDTSGIVGKTTTQTLTNKTLTSPLFTGTLNGWIAAEETWTYASADAPTYTITVPTDATTKYSAGMRIKLTHGGSVKYFIITKVAATVLTLYGGTDYTLADTAITLPYYSMVKAPYGFPLDPTKWTVMITDTTSRSQATPTQNVWYNLGTISIVVPIGVWNVNYIVAITNSTTGKDVRVTLSTANNSESDANNSCGSYIISAEQSIVVSKNIILILTAKTTHYLNTCSTSASSGTIMNCNNFNILVIRAVCAYL